MIYIYRLLCLFLLCSCSESESQRITRLAKEWSGKEILYPDKMIFSSLGKDTLNLLDVERDYTIMSYVDSVGCIDCKLQLDIWNDFIGKKDSIFENKVILLFFLHPINRREMVDLLEKHKFTYPVCLDMEDKFNNLNHFPSDIAFQTFLLDRENKVVAIGNPIHNPKIKELYMNILSGNISNKKTMLQTDFKIDNTSVDMGKFDWRKEQKAVFTLTNTGESPLVIIDVVTSCGCVSASYSKEPVQPGKEISLSVTYKADDPEHFNKAITVYCNTKASLFQLKISGNAQEVN